MTFYKKLTLFFSLLILGISALSNLANSATNTSEARPFSSSVDEGSGKLGLGLMLGEPSGVTGKYWISRTTAVDLGLAYSFNDYFAVLSDYLIHFPNAFNSTAQGDLKGQFVPFVGIGGIIFINSTASNSTSGSSNQHFFTDSNGNSAAFALRIPIGVEFLAKSTPLGVYAEFDPGVGIIPETFGFVEAQIGARFYF